MQGIFCDEFSMILLCIILKRAKLDRTHPNGFLVFKNKNDSR